MSMMKLLCGLAALPLIAGFASAEPAKQQVKLTDGQMDKVTAGISFAVAEFHNTGIVLVRAYGGTIGTDSAAIFEPGTNVILPGVAGNPNATPPTPAIPQCSPCYLNINNRALSVASIINGGPP